MLVTPHALAGAAIAVSFPNPVVSIPLAIGVHFVMDVIPHWQEVIGQDYKPNKITIFRLPIDILLATILVWKTSLLHPNLSFLIWLLAIISNIPDLDVVLVNINRSVFNIPLFKKYYDWHSRIQRETKSLFGVFTQIGLILIFLKIVGYL